jgi:hypothetical protein
MKLDFIFEDYLRNVYNNLFKRERLKLKRLNFKDKNINLESK